jgi:3-hydroxyacyl-[acyl-carrier-protein] dehydratase
MNALSDINKIMDILPHRYPILMVDKVLELEPGKRVTAVKNVTINEPFFHGHFPGKPIMPGVLILEAMAQAGYILAYASSFSEKKGMIYIVGIDKVRFRHPVMPGDQIVSKMQILRQRTKVVKMSGIAHVNNKKVAEAEFLASLGEKT